MDIIKKLILAECPDYDFDRYRFKPGDYINTLCGAQILVERSALNYVNAYVIKRSLKYREKGLQRVYYDDLPYLKKGTFINKLPKMSSGIKWNLWDFVHDTEHNMTGLLVEEVGHQAFYCFVINSENKYYTNTIIYIQNKFKDYIKYN